LNQTLLLISMATVQLVCPTCMDEQCNGMDILLHSYW
jgi:hypothetical protein